MTRSMFRTSRPGLCLAAFLMFLAPLPAGAQPQEDHQPVSIKDNAALWYWQAFNQMQGVDLNDLYQDWPPNIDTDKVQPWLQSVILTYLHRGANQPACAWGVDFEVDGINALLPHLGPARRLARLAGVRAEYFFQQGDIVLAVEDLVAAMVLGRHLPNPGILIDVLVQVSISRLTQEVLVKNLYRLDRAQLLRLQKLLADLPPRKTIAQAIVTEKHIPNWIVNRVREDGAESLRSILDEDVLNQEGFDKLMQQTGGTVEGFERIAEQMRGYYDQLQHILTLSYDEVGHAEDTLVKQIYADENALALLLLPACGAARHSELRQDARTAMLQAMIAYQLDGPEAFRRITDPYDGQPFEIEATESDLVIHSRMPDKDGNPISVAFPGIEMQSPDDQP